jgi:hypothetical protein
LLPDAGSKPAWETSGRPTAEHQASHGIPTATPGINQHSPLDRLTPPPSKKTKQNKKTLSNKQGTENKHAAEGMGVLKAHWRRGKELISM